MCQGKSYLFLLPLEIIGVYFGMPVPWIFQLPINFSPTKRRVKYGFYALYFILKGLYMGQVQRKKNKKKKKSQACY